MDSKVSKRGLTSFALILVVALTAAGCGGGGGGSAPVQQGPAVSATALSRHYVEVSFDPAPDAEATNRDRYSITSQAGTPLAVEEAQWTDDGQRVLLTTATQQPVSYQLTVSGPVDAVTPFQGSIGEEPRLLSAVSLGNTEVLLTFNTDMTGDKIGCRAVSVVNDPSSCRRYYQIIVAGRSDGVGSLFIDTAFLQVSDPTTVLMTTSPQTDIEYEVRAANVASAAGILIDPTASTARFIGYNPDDQTPPALASAEATSSTSILLTFSKPMEDAVGNPALYTITPSRLVTGASLRSNRRQVLLTTLPLVAGQQYAVMISSGVKDRGFIPIGDNTAEFTFAGSPATSDGSRPRVVGAASTGNTSVVVTFSKPMANNALNPSSYVITQANVNPEVGALIVVSSGAQPSSLECKDSTSNDPCFVRSDHTSVRLTTLSQSEVTYEVTVVDVSDLAGNPLQTPEFPGIDPSKARFPGTPPNCAAKFCDDGSDDPCSSDDDCDDDPPCGPSEMGCAGVCFDPCELADTDGDGLTDNVEQRGWTVTVVLANGDVQQYQVTSSPYVADTDLDGLDDREEWNLILNPRSADTDADSISDYDEFNVWYSEPTVQDSDEDGITDGLEIGFFKTSPILQDTDGDGAIDSEELFNNNRNPLISDLPRPRISVGDVALRLDTRFTFTDTQGVSRSTSQSTATTLGKSNSASFEQSDTSTVQNLLETGAKVGTEFTSGAKPDAKFSFEATFKYQYTNSHSGTVSLGSAEEASEEYNNSLEISESIDETQEVTREVMGASVQVPVNIGNASEIPFTISNLEITALVQNPVDRTSFQPVASLVPESELTLGESRPVNVGPFQPDHGPFVFTSRDVFPSLVEDLMANPRGLVFEVANFDVTDEAGRNLAFTSQDVNERTAGVVIDFGDREPQYFRVATTSTFDENGLPQGITLGYALQQILGMTKNGPPDAITLRSDNVCAVTSASAEDQQVIEPSCGPVDADGFVVLAGDNGRVNSAKRGDDEVVDGVGIKDGGDGCGHSTAAGDDVQASGFCDATSGSKAGQPCGAGHSRISAARPEQSLGGAADHCANTVAAPGDEQVVLPTCEVPIQPGSIIARPSLGTVLPNVVRGDDRLETRPMGQQMVQVIVDGGNGCVESYGFGPLAIQEAGRCTGPTGIGGSNALCSTLSAPCPAGEECRGKCANAFPGGDVVRAGADGILQTKAAPGDSVRSTGVLIDDPCTNPTTGRGSCVATCGRGINGVVIRGGGPGGTLAARQIRAGANGCADTVADPNDVQVVAPAEPGDPCNAATVVVDAGPNGVIDTLPAGDDELADFKTGPLADHEARATVSGYGTEMQGRCDGASWNPRAGCDIDADCRCNTAAECNALRDEQDNSTFPNGRCQLVEVLTRVQDVAEDLDTSRFWRIISSFDFPPGTDFDDIVLHAGDNISLGYVQDRDGDGVVAQEEFLYESSDRDTNTDDDPLSDSDEVLVGWDVHLGGRSYHVFSSPARPDTDADRLNDGEEEAAGTDPTKRDTDGDGISDFEELNGYSIVNRNGTEFLDVIVPYEGDAPDEFPEVIIDGGNGRVETTATGGDRQILLGPVPAFSVIIVPAAGANLQTSPQGDDRRVRPESLTDGADHERLFATDPLNPDTDGDGLSDGAERALGAHPNDGSDADGFRDNDRDGLTNLEESTGWLIGGNGEPGQKDVTFTLTGWNPGQNLCATPGVYSYNISLTRWDRVDANDRVTLASVANVGLFVNTPNRPRLLGATGKRCRGTSECAVGESCLAVPKPDWFNDAVETDRLELRCTAPFRTTFDVIPGERVNLWARFYEGYSHFSNMNPGAGFQIPWQNVSLSNFDHDGELCNDATTCDQCLVTPGRCDPLRADAQFLNRAVDITATTPQTLKLSGSDCFLDDTLTYEIRDNTVVSDPFDPDTDGDGLPDLLERVIGSDARSIDSDGDGLLDFLEFDLSSRHSITPAQILEFESRCAAADRCSYNPSGSIRFGTSVAKADTDGDGLTDYFELFDGWIVRTIDSKDANKLIPPYKVFSDPLLSDRDLDDSEDGQERAEGTDPHNPDTDNDGMLDGADPSPLGSEKKVTVTLVSLATGDPACDEALATAGPGDHATRFLVVVVKADGTRNVLQPPLHQTKCVPDATESNYWTNECETIDDTDQIVKNDVLSYIDDPAEYPNTTRVVSLAPGDTLELRAKVQERKVKFEHDLDVASWEMVGTFRFADIEDGTFEMKPGMVMAPFRLVEQWGRLNCNESDTVTWTLDVEG